MQTRQPDQRIADDTKPRRPWVIIPFVVAIGVLAVLVYQRFIAFDALTYALRACQSPLTAEASWSEVEAAGCEPLTGEGASVVLYEGTSRYDAVTAEDGVFAFDAFPIDATSHAVEISEVPPWGRSSSPSPRPSASIARCRVTPQGRPGPASSAIANRPCTGRS